MNINDALFQDGEPEVSMKAGNRELFGCTDFNNERYYLVTEIARGRSNKLVETSNEDEGVRYLLGLK